MAMSTRDVGKRLRAEVFPLLKAQGFGIARGKTFWRPGPVLTDVVRFGHLSRYVADVAGIETFSVQVEFGAGLNLGMPDLVRRAGAVPLPDPWHCLFRGAAGKALVQPQIEQGDIWQVEADGANLDAVIADIARVIRDDLPAWCARAHDLEAMQRLLETGDEQGFDLWGFGRPGSPAREAAVALVSRSRKVAG